MWAMPSSHTSDAPSLSADDLEADRSVLLMKDPEQGTSVQGTSRRFGLIGLLALSMCAAGFAGVLFMMQSGTVKLQGREDSALVQRSVIDRRIKYMVEKLKAKAVTTTKVLPVAKQNASEKNQSLENSTIWGDPFSMFCFVVVIPSEMPVIRWQFKHGAGIFQCTNWRVYSGTREAMLLGTRADGTVAKTTPIPGPKAFFGEAYFWGCNNKTKYLMNANILSRAWENAQAEGVAGLHSWIIKADPDTVLSPARLRKPLSMYLLDAASKTAPRYFKNCKTMDSMQGSLEILSRQAFYIYMGKKEECQKSMDWWHMGEDIFTFKCLQQLGVKSSDISEGVMDTYCSRSKSCVTHRGLPNCSLPDVAVFHPLKTRDQFETCWQEMRRVDDRSRNTDSGSIFAGVGF